MSPNKISQVKKKYSKSDGGESEGKGGDGCEGIRTLQNRIGTT